MKTEQTLIESIVEMKTTAQAAATLSVIAEVVSMLRRKGLLDSVDIDRMIAKLEAASAAMSAAAPETSKCVADAALNLRHNFIQETGKAN